MTKTAPTPSPNSKKRWLLIALPLIGLILASVVFAHAGPFGQRLGERFGHHGRHHLFSDVDGAKQRVESVAGWVLEVIDADAQQTVAIQSVLSTSVDELSAIAAVHRANRDRIHTELLSVEVDRRALEEIRQAELVLADDASRILVDALATIAEELTEEQKMELVEHFHRFHG